MTLSPAQIAEHLNVVNNSELDLRAALDALLAIDLDLIEYPALREYLFAYTDAVRRQCDYYAYLRRELAARGLNPHHHKEESPK
jgi:hypothetical protein